MRNEKKKKAPTLHYFNEDPLIPLNRLHILLCATAIAALLHRHLFSILSSPTPISSSLLLLSDVLLSFMWAVTQSFRWRPIHRGEHPETLALAVPDPLLPNLDVFICTADPSKEPPICVASAALSALAFDYPSDKLSVFVSDDGCSDLTLFAFMEAARFARHWLPFCKEMCVLERCPETFFNSTDDPRSDEIKLLYQRMKKKIESVMEKGQVSDDLFISEEDRAIFKKWKNFTRSNHPAVIQVLLQSSRDMDIMGNPLPNLVYVSREKSSTSFHHFKAGALNALLRVSGVMSNAPVILTMDCDMHCNDPGAPRRAMCYFLDPELSPKLAYVQFPQRFPGVNKNDIYGGEIKRLYQINPRGMDGLKGPNYVGTGCFHSRRSFYGPPSSPPSLLNDLNEQTSDTPLSSEAILRKAHEVASCKYEDGTKWGSTIGMRYGSMSEDYHTGYRLHCEGWESVFCDPERPAFFCKIPITLNDVLSQNKRWCLGVLEVFFSKHSPMIFGVRKVSFLMGLCYSYDGFWTSWCIPILIYGLLPQLALTNQIPLFPKVSDPWFYLYAYLFLSAYCQDLIDFLASKGTFNRWWSDQRMWLIRGITSYPFGATQFALKQIGIPAPGFNVTSKIMPDEVSKRYKDGIFEFGIVSPFFVSLGTVAIINMFSLIIGMANAVRKERSFDEMFVQLFLSAFVVVNSWPIYEAMFLRKDGGRIPRRVTGISILLAGILYSISYFLFLVY
ncbi:cellulose synthase-like protein G3 [Dioscorea cayenensis subsp. rotundata]|uniref:Cellulose synthase-like protein G3 n=1 Tax=Dioscorea cayennensis subsp. rotundata TaxID=55577 RepID=A0AB40ALG2_DIOCR|nr:cellulose synthase-like protein G3 [Dioscorea cayenensis subsp. rotundata]